MAEEERCCVDSPPPQVRHPLAMSVILLTLLAGVSAAMRLLAMLATTEPLGTDGYYYVVQVSDLVHQGRLHVPDGSWVLYLLGGLHALIPSPQLAVKVGAVLLGATCIPLAWWIGLGLERKLADQAAGVEDPRPTRTGLAWLLAFWAAASPTLTQLGADFPKNLGVLPWALLLGALALRTRKGIATWVACALAMLVCAWAHRLGAALLMLSILGLTLGWWLARKPFAKLGGRPWLAPVVLLVSFALFAIASLILPGLLHPADLERLRGQFDFSLGWPGPWAWFQMRQFHPAQEMELSLPWLGLLLGFLLFWRKPALRPLLGALLVPLLVCLNPFWRRDELDLGYRLSLMTPPLTVIIFALAWRIWLPPLPTGRFIFAALFALGLISTSLARHGFQLSELPPYDHYRQLIARIPKPLPRLLIAHQGINFLYDHLSGQEAMAWAPEKNLDRTHIGRLVWGVRDGEWLALPLAQSGLPQPKRLDSNYVYAREDVWQLLLSSARAEGERDLLERLGDWRNPQKVRSLALLRNRAKSP